MIKSNPKQKLFLEKMHYFGGKITSVFVEKHIFRGYVISIEDVSRARTTEDVIHNIQGESNS